MSKYVAAITFEWNEDTMQLIPLHREYINGLIESQVIEQYVVSMEVQSIWVTINAGSKKEVRELLSKSPFYKYWKIEVYELIVWDGLNYRLPAVQLN